MSIEEITNDELKELFDENGEYYTGTLISKRNAEGMNKRIENQAKEIEGLENKLKLKHGVLVEAQRKEIIKCVKSLAKKGEENTQLKERVKEFEAKEKQQKECNHKFKKAYFVNNDNQPIDYIGLICAKCDFEDNKI